MATVTPSIQQQNEAKTTKTDEKESTSKCECHNRGYWNNVVSEERTKRSQILFMCGVGASERAHTRASLFVDYVTHFLGKICRNLIFKRTNCYHFWNIAFEEDGVHTQAGIVTGTMILSESLLHSRFQWMHDCLMKPTDWYVPYVFVYTQYWRIVCSWRTTTRNWFGALVARPIPITSMQIPLLFVKFFENKLAHRHHIDLFFFLLSERVFYLSLLSNFDRYVYWEWMFE